MSTLPRVVSISNVPSLDAQRRELLQRLRHRVFPLILSALLDGGDGLRACDLIWTLRLERKRRSFAHQIVGWVVGSLRQDGTLPAGFAVMD